MTPRIQHKYVGENHKCLSISDDTLWFISRRDKQDNEQGYALFDVWDTSRRRLTIYGAEHVWFDKTSLGVRSISKKEYVYPDLVKKEDSSTLSFLLQSTEPQDIYLRNIAH